MKRVLRTLNAFLAELSGWLLTIITFFLVLNFMLRLFEVSIDWLLELTTFVFVAVIYLGLAHGEERDEHIKVNFIIDRVPKGLKKILTGFNYLVTLGMGALLVYAAYLSAWEAYAGNETLPGTYPLPTFPVKSIIFFGLLLFTLVIGVKAYEFFKGKGQ
jgi:TRAP-type C4-dicarboxylate transport system permease small subunit